MSDYHVEPVELTATVLSERVKSLYDYRCAIVAAEQRWILLSFGVSPLVNCNAVCLAIGV